MSFFTSFEFFVREAWNSLRRSGVMPLVSLATITVSLVIFGSFILITANLTHFASSVGSKVEIAAYTDRSLSDEESETIRRQLKTIKGVVSVGFMHRDIAWKKFREEYGARLSITEVYQKNPLPNTFTIRVSNPKYVPEVAKTVSNFAAIDEVRYSGHLAERVNAVLMMVRLGGIVVVSLLLLATLLIVVNTIRLTVLAREREITIMRLVGATDAFIKGPFLIEGLMLGFVGAALSFVMLKFSYDGLISRFMESLPFLPWIDSGPLLFAIYVLVGSLGMVLGLLGGYISVSRLLKVQDNN